MMNQLVFERTLRGAMEAAALGRTDEWVDAFLSSGVGANLPMGVGLKKQRRWWIGPVLLPLDQFRRVAGPEPEMEYRCTHEAWDSHVTTIMGIEREHLPPVIAEYVGQSRLRLHDGSHRHEASHRRGQRAIWALIWCNTECDFLIANSLYGAPAKGG